MTDDSTPRPCILMYRTSRPTATSTIAHCAEDSMLAHADTFSSVRRRCVRKMQQPSRQIPYARVCLGSVFQQGQVGRLLHVADGGSQQDICGPEAARQRAIRSQNDVDAAGTKCTHGGEAPAQVPPLPSLGIAVPWLFCSIEIADSAISWRQPSVSNGSISRQHPAERP